MAVKAISSYSNDIYTLELGSLKGLSIAN